MSSHEHEKIKREALQNDHSLNEYARRSMLLFPDMLAVFRELQTLTEGKTISFYASKINEYAKAILQEVYE